MSEDVAPKKKGPWQVKRDPKSWPSSKVALLPERKQDWVYARAQYESGVKSVAQIAREIGVGPTSVFAHASNEHWVRDRDVLAKKEVEIKATLEMESQEKLIIERQRAERVNAEMQATILVTHRADIRRARDLTMRLFAELEQMMDELPELTELGTLLRAEDERGRDRLNDAYRKVLSLPDRVDVNKKLSEALKVQLQLERQAFGIQGALEDPEIQLETRVSGSEIDTILDKFDLVMKKKGSTSAPVGSIIDVPSLN